MKHIILTIALFGCMHLIMAQPPKVYVMDAQRLVSLKQQLQQKDAATVQLVQELQKKADVLLNMKPVSVMDKGITPPSGNKHDYMSQAPYFWYDSTKPNGLPYIRRDGQRNPEIYKITDRTYLGELETASRTLALAWYFTGNEKYATKAATLIRHWFLNADTKMNPHLEYGQGIPGINTGRGIGIIETRTLAGIADAAGILQASKSWAPKDHQALQQWYAQYLNWLLTSKYGNDEHAAKNNHGSWYYVQVVDFALFTGDTQKAKALAEESKARLASQLSRDGRMELELDRTNGLGYTTMNIQAWFTMAKLGEVTGTDLWNYANQEGATIRTALDWILPYAMKDKPWIYQQIGNYDKEGIYSLLLQAAKAYKDQKYADNAKRLDGDVNNVMIDILYKH
jgi:hypothetical protein